jgi:hypothetical protein
MCCGIVLNTLLVTVFVAFGLYRIRYNKNGVLPCLQGTI